jgi:hypothetical protein
VDVAWHKLGQERKITFVELVHILYNRILSRLTFRVDDPCLCKRAAVAVSRQHYI